MFWILCLEYLTTENQSFFFSILIDFGHIDSSHILRELDKVAFKIFNKKAFCDRETYQERQNSVSPPKKIMGKNQSSL